MRRGARTVRFEEENLAVRNEEFLVLEMQTDLTARTDHRGKRALKLHYPLVGEAAAQYKLFFGAFADFFFIHDLDPKFHLTPHRFGTEPQYQPEPSYKMLSCFILQFKYNRKNFFCKEVFADRSDFRAKR